VLGNHDNRFLDTFQGTECPNRTWVRALAGSGALPSPYYAVEHEGFQFLVLDGTDGAFDHASNDTLILEEEQLAWVEERLALDLPTVLFAHQAIRPGHRDGDDDHPLLPLLEAKAEFVRGVFMGHEHQWVRGQWRDIRFYEGSTPTSLPGEAYHLLECDPGSGEVTVLNEDSLPYEIEYGLQG